MPGFNEPLLVNIIGHAAGALLFAIFLVLLFSGRGWSGARGRYLSGLAAGLALVWNLGSLVVLVIPRLHPMALALVVATSFSALSLLPAVLLHLWLADRRRSIVISGYSLGVIAIAMHFCEVPKNDPAIHQAAILLITIGFLILTAVAVGLAAFRRQAGPAPGIGRIAASMSLALFAMSFVHFGSAHAVEAWSSELVIHHAGIPLALFVLLQDYRFVLLDAFVRFLANALLAAVLTWLMITAVFQFVPLNQMGRKPVTDAVLLIGICLFLPLFAWLRDRVMGWLTHAVFGHDGVSRAAARLRSAPRFPNEPECLKWAGTEMTAAVRAERWEVAASSALEGTTNLRTPVLATACPAVSGLPAWDWVEAIVPVRLTQGDSRLFLLGRRRGGQRYLRDDLDALAAAAAEIVGHVESLRREEMHRLVTQAELRALQSQINPHFLFNALNTVYGTIPREAPGARRMILNLADIFRYFLQSNKVFVPLSDEMQIVRAYLEIEQGRLGERLKVDVYVDDGALSAPIPALSIQPLVENAIKHGVAQRSGAGYVSIRAESSGDSMRVVVENSRAPGGSQQPGAGVALQNVRRRLEICYGREASLHLTIEGERAAAELRIPVKALAGQAV